MKGMKRNNEQDGSLAVELRQREINVPRAALVYTRAIAFPDLDVGAYLRRLDDLAGALAHRGPVPDGLDSQAAYLAGYLAGELGFRGNVGDYGDPRNSLLNDVIDRRLGLPITLSVVYVAVARRLGIDARGVGLPGHFIVGLYDGPDVVWIDPFHGGLQLDHADCAELVRLATGYEGPLEGEWFQPVSAREILTRMLANLRIAYTNQGDWAREIATLRQLQLVNPGAPEYLRDIGLARYRMGAIPTGAYYLNEYLTRSPAAHDVAVVQDGLRQLVGRWGSMN